VTPSRFSANILLLSYLFKTQKYKEDGQTEQLWSGNLISAYYQ